MSNTKGDLVQASIYKADEDGKKIGFEVPCMFNPYEYTVSKTNTYAEKSKNQSDAPSMDFKKAGAQTLKLSLIFDTYDTDKEKQDVSKITRDLWKFMQPTEAVANSDKKEPPRVAFHWGVFRFAAVITSMTQKFTLFLIDGTPVRAKVDVTFTQHKDTDDYRGQNPTSGGGPVMGTYQIIRGDRLDNIAADVYGDATQWRYIADYNGIDNPLALRTGRRIVIPEINK
ncbi:MAG: LysM peptidoglycan-binding domain-containing protein [Chloroflexi bacterium]|nr:LysM peptidoglycan-binding domain-containing protein [Chloroflexota bacterium]